MTDGNGNGKGVSDCEADTDGVARESEEAISTAVNEVMDSLLSDLLAYEDQVRNLTAPLFPAKKKAQVFAQNEWWQGTVSRIEGGGQLGFNYHFKFDKMPKKQAIIEEKTPYGEEFVRKPLAPRRIDRATKLPVPLSNLNEVDAQCDQLRIDGSELPCKIVSKDRFARSFVVQPPNIRSSITVNYEQVLAIVSNSVTPPPSSGEESRTAEDSLLPLHTPTVGREEVVSSLSSQFEMGESNGSLAVSETDLRAQVATRFDFSGGIAEAVMPPPPPVSRKRARSPRLIRDSHSSPPRKRQQMESAVPTIDSYSAMLLKACEDRVSKTNAVAMAALQKHVSNTLVHTVQPVLGMMRDLSATVQQFSTDLSGLKGSVAELRAINNRGVAANPFTSPLSKTAFAQGLSELHRRLDVVGTQFNSGIDKMMGSLGSLQSANEPQFAQNLWGSTPQQAFFPPHQAFFQAPQSPFPPQQPHFQPPQSPFQPQQPPFPQPQPSPVIAGNISSTGNVSSNGISSAMQSLADYSLSDLCSTVNPATFLSTPSEVSSPVTTANQPSMAAKKLLYASDAAVGERAGESASSSVLVADDVTKADANSNASPSTDVKPTIKIRTEQEVKLSLPLVIPDRRFSTTDIGRLIDNEIVRLKKDINERHANATLNAKLNCMLTRLIQTYHTPDELHAYVNNIKNKGVSPQAIFSKLPPKLGLICNHVYIDAGVPLVSTEDTEASGMALTQAKATIKHIQGVMRSKKNKQYKG